MKIVNKTEMTVLARQLSQLIQSHPARSDHRSGRLLIFLEGPMGSGKTFLINLIVAELTGIQFKESSPTFTLVRQYSKNIYHVDLYRIDSADEMLEAGIYDLVDQRTGQLAFIEWADRFPKLATPDLTIKLDYHGEQQRSLEFIGSPATAAVPADYWSQLSK